MSFQLGFNPATPVLLGNGRIADVRRADIRSHNNDRILEIHDPPFRVR